MKNRGESAIGLGLLCALAVGACVGGGGGSGGSGGGTGGDRGGDGGAGDACAAGDTRACLGPGACDGAQSCKDDGSGWDSCDCGGGDGDGDGDGDDPAADASVSGPDAAVVDDREMRLLFGGDALRSARVTQAGVQFEIHPVSVLQAGQRIDDVAWADERFVAIGDFGVATSPDLVDWSLTAEAFAADEAVGLLHCDGTFLVQFRPAAGGNDYVASSSDGSTGWVAGPPSPVQFTLTDAWNGVACGGGAIVNGSSVSVDGGMTWVQHAGYGTVVFGNGHFIGYRGGNGDTYTSLDGVTWDDVPVTSNASGPVLLSYSGGRFYSYAWLGVGEPTINVSDDAIDWTAVGLTASACPSPAVVAFDERVGGLAFVAGGSYTGPVCNLSPPHFFLSSLDGNVWTAHSAGEYPSGTGREWTVGPVAPTP